MKNILRKNKQFQTIPISLFRFLFCEIPAKEFTPYVFISPAQADRDALKTAAARFELKKSGGAR